MLKLAIFLAAFAVIPATQAQYNWGYTPGYPSYPPRYAPPPPPPSGKSLAREMVDAHNVVRARVGSPPLVWSSQLAAYAQGWAGNLIATHRFMHSSGNRYGENIYAISGGFASAAQVVASWADEARGYDIRNNGCAGVCGHYTQIVWRTTRGVGCAVAAGAGREVWVCEYDPPGNVVGQRPY